MFHHYFNLESFPMTAYGLWLMGKVELDISMCNTRTACGIWPYCFFGNLLEILLFKKESRTAWFIFINIPCILFIWYLWLFVMLVLYPLVLLNCIVMVYDIWLCNFNWNTNMSHHFLCHKVFCSYVWATP